MNDRPLLNTDLNGDSFRKWYWLKEELVTFCRDNGLPSNGSKTVLTERIAYFLDTGKVLLSNASKRTATKVTSLSLDSIIETDIVCS